MNIAAERLEREELLEPTIIKNREYDDTATIGSFKGEFPIMKDLAKRMDNIDIMSPIFYFHTNDIYARKIAYAYILPEMRVIYSFENRYKCVFDYRLLYKQYEHLHLYFRKDELLAVQKNDPERGRYFGVSIPLEPDFVPTQQKLKRVSRVENFAMDLKLGIYDVRFELFFCNIFDFYKTSGIKW